MLLLKTRPATESIGDAMTASTPGRIERTPPRSTQLRDLSDPSVRDQIVAEARQDAYATLLRDKRAAARRRQAG